MPYYSYVPPPPEGLFASIRFLLLHSKYATNASTPPGGFEYSGTNKLTALTRRHGVYQAATSKIFSTPVINPWRVNQAPRGLLGRHEKNIYYPCNKLVAGSGPPSYIEARKKIGGYFYYIDNQVNEIHDYDSDSVIEEIYIFLLKR